MKNKDLNTNTRKKFESLDHNKSAVPSKKSFNQEPGKLVYTGHEKVNEPYIEILSYNKDSCESSKIAQSQIDQIQVKSDRITWLNVVGLSNTNQIAAIGAKFGFHKLALEDVVNVEVRPKFNDYDDHFLLIAKTFIEKKNNLTESQVSLIVKKGVLISFQEKPSSNLNDLKQRIENNSSLARTHKTDYLAFSILDNLVDQYMQLIEELGLAINAEEANVMGDLDKPLLKKLSLSKRETNYLKKYIGPLKVAIMSLNRSDNPLIQDSCRPYLNSLSDHINQTMETLDSLTETVNSNLQTYDMRMNDRLNDTLKLLTLFSVIFIPITFLAGIYGMNFEFMPELKWHWGYPALWLVMIVITIWMVKYFKKKKWL